MTTFTGVAVGGAAYALRARSLFAFGAEFYWRSVALATLQWLVAMFLAAWLTEALVGGLRQRRPQPA
jgi:hypothetical protein